MMSRSTTTALQELESHESSLKDILKTDSTGSLFDSISWLLMNAGSIDIDNDPTHMSMSMASRSGFLGRSIERLMSADGFVVCQPDGVDDFSLRADSLAEPFLSGYPPSSANTNIPFMGASVDLAANGFISVKSLEQGDDSPPLARSPSSDDTPPSIGRGFISNPQQQQGAYDSDSDDDDDSDEEPKKGGGRKRKSSAVGGNNSARVSVKGKRQRGNAINELEARIKELQEENAELKTHLVDVTQRAVDMEKQRHEMETKMVEKASSVSDRNPIARLELQSMLDKYTDVFADYGTCRQKELAFHLGQLEKLLLPTQTTKMCLWTLQQDKSFYQSNKSPLFDMLSKELGLTHEQSDSIQTRRKRILKLLEKLQESINLTGSLKTSIEKKHTVFLSKCRSLQSVISPEQVVLLLNWINKNGDLLSKVIPDFDPAVVSEAQPELGTALARSSLDSTESHTTNYSSGSSIIGVKI